MKRHKTMSAWEVFIVALLGSGTVWGASPQLSLRYDEAAPADAAEAVRIYEAEVPPVAGTVYVYATIQMGPANPINYVDGLPEWRPESTPAPAGGDQGAGAEEDDGMGGFVMKEHHPPAPDREGRPQFLQTITLGHNADGQFIPALRFGLADDGRAQEQAMVCPWVSDGYIDYFAGYARPNTPYDFKLKLDLDNKRMSAWVSGRGDDDWFFLAEDVALTTEAGQVNTIQAEMYPGAPVIDNLTVRDRPWAPAERVQPHPLADKNRVVGPGRGFTFQSLRSTWHKPSKHVTIFRKPGVHAGFPDVAQAGPNHLVCAWRNGSHTGGTGGLSLAHSYDLGQSWEEPVLVTKLGGNCPRIQRLKDGTLLLLVDVASGGNQFVASWDVVMWDSTDGGQTWTNERWLRARKVGGGGAIVPSRMAELSDGSWLLAASSFPDSPFSDSWAEKLEFYRSADRGTTWEALSAPMAYPPHCLSEPSPIQLPNGRIVVYSRESRTDGMPGAKFYSDDGGRNWQFQELPHPITGRTCAALLSDGRVMNTFRSGVGRAALRAWIGDPDDPTTSQIAGGHFNDRHTVGLKDGALHIDNDGICGQFTKYSLRPADSPETTVDVTAEVKVVENRGRAATLSVPFAGRLRIFPDRVEMAHDPSLSFEIEPDQFHTYRVVGRVGRMQLYIDGGLAIDGDKGDDSLRQLPWVKISHYDLSFGNEWGNMPDVYPRYISPEVTGYSIWRRVEATLDDPKMGQHVLSWVAARDGFPDQYQLDHMMEIEASVSGHDQGYSGWIELDDGRIFVVHYTDDTSSASRPNPHQFGVPWIRGTFVSPADLPPATE